MSSSAGRVTSKPPANGSVTRAAETSPDIISGPLFPAESWADAGPPGGRAVRGRRILSPVYPADSELARVFSFEFLNAPPGARSEWLGMVTRDLFQLTSSPTDPGLVREK